MRIAAVGSPRGTGGIVTIPAPRRPRPLPFEETLGVDRREVPGAAIAAVDVATLTGDWVSGAVPQVSQ